MGAGGVFAHRHSFLELSWPSHFVMVDLGDGYASPRHGPAKIRQFGGCVGEMSPTPSR